MPKTTADANRNGVLAIHLGDNVGYCIDGNPQVWVLPKHSGNGYVGAAMLDALSDLSRVSAPSRIVVSSSLDDVETPEDASVIVGLSMCVQVFGCRRGIPVELVHPSNVHQAIFERDDMTKRQVKSAVSGLAKRRGLGLCDMDACHALVLHEFANQVRAAA